MSTTCMVKSTLMSLVCHINIVLMTVLFLFNLSKSTTQHYILSVFLVGLYVFGLLFNVYVILFVGRKWELVTKYFNRVKDIVFKRMLHYTQVICTNFKDAMEYVSAAVNSIIETCRHFDLEGSNSAPLKPLSEEEPLVKSIEECIVKEPAPQDDTVGRVSIAAIFQNEFVTNVQPVSEDKTPDLMKMYNLRSVNRPKSDPIKKTVKSEIVKPQSPELLKNKIFKSRMNLTCDSPCSRMDKRNK